MLIKRVKIGEAILARLDEIGVSRAELARTMKMSRQSFTNFDERKVWTTDEVCRYCDALNYNFFKLFIDVEKPEDYSDNTNLIANLKKSIEDKDKEIERLNGCVDKLLELLGGKK